MAILSLFSRAIGQLASNTYLLYDEQTKEGILIDPGEDCQSILEVVSEHNVQVLAIFATHGHFDHLLGLLEVRLATGAEFFLHAKDEFLLARAQKTAQHFLGYLPDPVPTTFTPLIDGARQTLSNFSLQIIHTPGHTPGSTCFYLAGDKKIKIFYNNQLLDNSGLIFTGDTLLPEEKTDLSHQYSSNKAWYDSIKKIASLPPNTLVLPGHGEAAPLAFYSSIF